MTSLTRPICLLIKGIHFLRGKTGEDTNGVKFDPSRLLRPLTVSTDGLSPLSLIESNDERLVKVFGHVLFTPYALQNIMESLQCFGALSFEDLSWDTVFSWRSGWVYGGDGFLGFVNSRWLIKSLHDWLLRNLLRESRLFNCERPVEWCQEVFSPAISESFLFLDQARSVRRQQGEAPWSRRAIDCSYGVEVLNLLNLLLPSKVLHFPEFCLHCRYLNLFIFEVDDGSLCPDVVVYLREHVVDGWISLKDRWAN